MNEEDYRQWRRRIELDEEIKGHWFGWVFLLLVIEGILGIVGLIIIVAIFT